MLQLEKLLVSIFSRDESTQLNCSDCKWFLSRLSNSIDTTVYLVNKCWILLDVFGVRSHSEPGHSM